MTKFVISQKAGNYVIYDKKKSEEVSDTDLSHHICIYEDMIKQHAIQKK